jgi:hypothetical protein
LQFSHEFSFFSLESDNERVAFFEAANAALGFPVLQVSPVVVLQLQLAISRGVCGEIFVP